MPSLNQANYIELAIKSVLEQKYRYIELIVADGGSTDGTIQLLESLAARDVRLRWFSELDNGPAHALNKALTQVRGTIIGWLNSDDLYENGTVERAVTVLNNNINCLMVYGHGQHIDSHGRYISDYPTYPPSTPLDQFSKGCFICQPTVFFKRSLYLMLGKLDESLVTAFDFEYWLRAFQSFPDRIGFVNCVQAYSRIHDDCITFRQRRKVALEGMELLAKYLGYAPKEWLLTYVVEMLRCAQTSSEINKLKVDVNEFRLKSDQLVNPKEVPILEVEIEQLFKINNKSR